MRHIEFQFSAMRDVRHVRHIRHRPAMPPAVNADGDGPGQGGCAQPRGHPEARAEPAVQDFVGLFQIHREWPDKGMVLPFRWIIHRDIFIYPAGGIGAMFSSIQWMPECPVQSALYRALHMAQSHHMWLSRVENRI